MRRIALSLELLSQLEYHWFAGIRKSSSNKKSIGSAVSELIENEDKRAVLTQGVMSVLALSMLYRLLFWVFNSSYRRDYYLLSAYKSYSDYKERWSSLTNTDQKEARKRGWFYTRSAPLNMNDLWFEKHIEVLIAKNMIQFPVDTTEKPPETLNLSVKEQEGIKQTLFFSSSSQKLESDVVNSEYHLENNPNDILINVTQVTSSTLGILGIHLVAGDSIFLSQVVKAYKQKALKTHPDKNKSPNAHEEFVALNNAYQTLLEAAKRKSSGYSKNNSFDERYVYVDKLFKEFREKVKRYSARVDSYIKNANEYIADANEYIVDANEYIKDAKKCINDFKECKEQTDRYLERADQFLDESAAFFKLADNYFQQVNRAKQTQLVEEKVSKKEELPCRQIDRMDVVDLDEEGINENNEHTFFVCR